MPVITVETWVGKSPEQKRALVAAITDAMVSHFDSSVDKTIVVIHENPLENWGHAGELSADKFSS